MVTTTLVCTRCPSTIRDTSFALCPACALVADAEAFGDIDTIAVDPFFEAQSGWAERVWSRICTSLWGISP